MVWSKSVVFEPPLVPRKHVIIRIQIRLSLGVDEESEVRRMMDESMTSVGQLEVPLEVDFT